MLLLLLGGSEHEGGKARYGAVLLLGGTAGLGFVTLAVLIGTEELFEDGVYLRNASTRPFGSADVSVARKPRVARMHRWSCPWESLCPYMVITAL